MATTVVTGTTLKVNGAVNGAFGGGLTSSGTLYTAPSTGYAVVQLGKVTTSGNITFTIGGRQVMVQTGTAAAFGGFAFYVGPSQSVSWSSSTLESTSGSIYCVGVEFINSP